MVSPLVGLVKAIERIFPFIPPAQDDMMRPCFWVAGGVRIEHQPSLKALLSSL
jgi:hypothetical protein